MIRFFKSFFYAKNRPAPVYFWATVFCGLTVAMLILRFTGKTDFSDALILGVLGFVLGWIALYNYRKNGEEHENNN